MSVRHDRRTLRYDRKVPNELEDRIIRRIQERCADLLEREEDAPLVEGGERFQWTVADATEIAGWLNETPDPWDLFTFIDEQTGHFTVGYKTRDGREWFPILRQMRNTVGGGLIENMRPRYG